MQEDIIAEKIRNIHNPDFYNAKTIGCFVDYLQDMTNVVALYRNKNPNVKGEVAYNLLHNLINAIIQANQRGFSEDQDIHNIQTHAQLLRQWVLL